MLRSAIYRVLACAIFAPRFTLRISPRLPPMKLSRLYRPQDRRFWLMIVLNLLSAVLAWFLRSWPLVPLATVVVALFALGNAALGMFIAWDLLRDERDD